MADYELAPAAEEDLFNIALYGFRQFGLKQSDRYREGLKARFQVLATNPLQYPAVPHIRPGYRRSVYRAHSIYFRVKGKKVVIMRILGRQDAQKALARKV